MRWCSFTKARSANRGRFYRRLAPGLLLLGLAACDNRGGAGTDTGQGVPGDALMFGADHNYTYTGDVSISAIEVEAGADSTIDWCALTTDIRDRAVTDPSAVDQVLLAEFIFSQEEVMAKVATNEIQSNDSSQQWLVQSPGACTVSMSEFEVIGTVFDPADGMIENPATSWLVSVVNTGERATDILMSAFVVPLDTSTNTLVTVDDDSATLDFQADLHSATPLQVAAGDVPWLDWSGITTDVNGAPYESLLGDRLLIGKVAVETIEEAEQLFLRLDEEAEALYYADTYALTSVDLGIAKTADGASFEGFTTDGVWFVGIECLTCISPAPLILAVVEVSE